MKGLSERAGERERESRERYANMWGTKGVVTGLYRKYRIPLAGRFFLRSPYSFTGRFVIKAFLIFFILSMNKITNNPLVVP